MSSYTRIRARLDGLQNEDAATTVEYGLIIALISIFIIGGAGAIGLALSGYFNGVAGQL